MRKKLLSFSINVLLLLICLFVVIAFFVASNSPADYSEAFFDSMLKSEAKEENALPKIKAFVYVMGNNIIKIKQELILTKAVKDFHAYIPSKNFAHTVIKSVYTDEGIETFNINDTNLLINMPASQDKIILEYELKLYNNNSILSYTGNKILLTNFLITPAVYKDGKYIETYTCEFGDPFIYDIYSYDITLRTDKQYVAYGGGKSSERIDGSNRITRFLIDNYRDFSLIICKSSNCITEKFDDINITYVDSYVARPYVENAINFATSSFSDYPFKDLIIVSVPINNYGMEFSGMIFVNEKLFRNTERLKDLIYHEILHQWFYGILGVDQLNEPFLDEGLVTFFTYYLSNTLDKNCAFDSNLFNMKLCDYANKSMYLQLAYANSSNYINSLYQKYGHDKFFKKIKKIFEERAFSIISYEDFKSYFE